MVIIKKMNIILLSVLTIALTNAMHITTHNLNVPKRLERVTDPIELSAQGYPVSQNACLFKLDNYFYDFTPFKLTMNVWPAYWVNQLDPTDSYQY